MSTNFLDYTYPAKSDAYHSPHEPSQCARIKRISRIVSLIFALKQKKACPDFGADSRNPLGCAFNDSRNPLGCAFNDSRNPLGCAFNDSRNPLDS